MSLHECVGAFIVQRESVLLGKRSADRSSYPNVWDVFWRHIELGEFRHQALARELFEELGILPTRSHYLETVGIKGSTPTKCHFYLVPAWSGTPASRQPHDIRKYDGSNAKKRCSWNPLLQGTGESLTEYAGMPSMRVDPADFRKLDLRCHALLSDVPLHDVWAIPLHDGGPARTMAEVRALMFGDRRPPTNVAVRALFALRWWLGRVFGWDDERHDPSGASYVHRLTEADRVQSQVPPGTRDGRFQVLYVWRHEALSEIRNATVHGFLASALTHRDQGYVLYLAIYVKAVSRFTTLYMALIDPFRRFVVYPAIVRTVQQAWLRTYR